MVCLGETHSECCIIPPLRTSAETKPFVREISAWGYGGRYELVFAIFNLRTVVLLICC
jgi:hypothetical protein